MYRIYKNILHSFQGDFKILVKSDIFWKNFMAHSWSFQDDLGGITCMGIMWALFWFWLK